MTPAEQIALWADQLRDLSATGLNYTDGPYDRARYETIREIAMAMSAYATGTTLDALEPLRVPIFSRPTPLTGGEGAVVDPADGRMLLIRRADTGQWAMPGGGYEVGETPAEGAVREVLEETGIRCRVTDLVGVFDSRLCGTISRHHIYHFVFLCRPLNREAPGPQGTPQEVLQVAWFDEREVPQDLFPGHAVRIAEVWRFVHHTGPAYFDR